ncbi:MAG: glycosyltransferase family 4 protein [Anaerolineae bacterium]|nr:glycosyltransferase family 4 protein [Anaerolineae bacterium]
MRVLMLSKACIVGIYQRKLEEMAAIDSELELTLAVPPYWKSKSGTTTLHEVYTQGYALAVLPVAFNGKFHIHFYPKLGHLIKKIQPHIVHIDEEPYNFATFHANLLARRFGAKTLWFSWQNLDRQYPPPFSWMEQYNLHHIDHAIAGSQSAAHIWRRKGYQGPLSVIAQFGVDPEIFSPSPNTTHADTVRIAYAGRFVQEKGIDLLIHALSELKGRWSATFLGSGPAERQLRALVDTLDLRQKVKFKSQIPSIEMPDFYRQTDILVLPSRTLPNWAEQFGRVLIEAMACETCVVGSDSGEIPYVLGDAGLVFAEGDAAQLRLQLQHLIDHPDQRAELGKKSRERVLKSFTQKQVAQATLEIYRELIR